jgi:hypothetical protein
LKFTHRKILLTLSLFISGNLFAQLEGISISTEMNLMRSFKKNQRFIVIGPSTSARFHFTPKDEGFAMFTYFIPGRFKNKLEATAKNQLVTPQQVSYTSKARMRLQQFALGWRKYVKGTCNMEKGWSLYGAAAFGILFGSVINTHTPVIDTARYNLPVLAGEGKFKRLTIDLGAGWEQAIAPDFYLYAEAKASVPTTDYPSNYLFVNSKAPFMAGFAAGLRIFF